MYISIDIGGSNLRLAYSKKLDQPRFDKIVKIKVANNYAQDLTNITQTIKKFRVSTQEPIQGIGISAPGELSPNKNFIKTTPNLTSLISKPIVKDLRKQFRCRILMENDANLAALGEALYGHGQKENFIFIIWGTGIGGAIVYHINGKIFIPPSEPGHQIIDLGGPKCGCGQRGCLESFCGGAGIQKLYKKPAKELTEKEWGEVLKHLGHGLLNFIRTNPVNLVVFGGGIAIKQPKRLRLVKKFLDNNLKTDIPQIKISKYKDNIALYGALGLFRHKLIEN